MAPPHEEVCGAVFSGAVRVAAIDSAGTARIWDSGSDARIAKSGSDSTVTNALLSPDGGRVAVLSGTAPPMGPGRSPFVPLARTSSRRPKVPRSELRHCTYLACASHTRKKRMGLVGRGTSW